MKLLPEDFRATELDCKVAAMVMGWLFWKDKERDQVHCRVKGESFPWESWTTPGKKRFERVTPAQAARMEFYEEAPKFSQEIEYAWEALEEASSTQHFSLERSGEQWIASFGPRKASAKTAAVAICLALVSSRKERTK